MRRGGAFDVAARLNVAWLLGFGLILWLRERRKLFGFWPVFLAR